MLSETIEEFVDEACEAFATYPVTLEIAKIARRLQGEQMSRGITIDFEDLLIGVTALQLKYEVATLNGRHFMHIPRFNLRSI